jgi:putative membrane protein
MNRFLLRAIVASAGLWLAAQWLTGLNFADNLNLVMAALLLGLVNAFIRPVIVLLTLPLTVLTIGLFLLVINALMLGLVAAVLPGFSIDGFGTALLGALVVGIVSGLGMALIGPRLPPPDLR